MNEYNPDRWIIIKHTSSEETIYKVFGTWGGGYLSSDAWRINSGIESVTCDEDYYCFKGFSGSVYKCYKNSYGVTGSYNYGILNQLESKLGVELLSKEQFLEEFYCD